MKQLTVRQSEWIDQQVPQAGPDNALLSMSSIINDLYALGGVVVSYTTNGTINTADTVTHNLGRVPAGYLVIQNGNGGVVYNGGASQAFSATTTTISLKCTTASNITQILIF